MHRRLVSRWIGFLFVVLSVLPPSLLAGLRPDPRLDATDMLNAGGHPFPPAGPAPVFWQGDDCTLPFGWAQPPASLNAHAVTMPAVQQAITEFTARGYIRRPDLDESSATDHEAITLLAFEKPGYDVSEAQPIIAVVTRPVRINVTVGAPPDLPLQTYFWILGTQVSGALYAHLANDSLAVVDAPGDPPINVTGEIQTPLGAYPAYSGEGLAALFEAQAAVGGMEPWMTAYTVYGQYPVNAWWTYHTGRTPDFWEHLAVNVGISTVLGMSSAVLGGVPLVVALRVAALAGIGEATKYWYNH